MSNETVNEIELNGDIWKKVVIKHFGKPFEDAVRLKYEVSKQCLVRNTKTKLVMSHTKLNRVMLCGDTIKKSIVRQRICLGSFFPDDIPDDINEMNCVFIDGDNTNMAVSNLQWMTKSDTTKATHERTKGTRKSQVEKQGKKVKIVSVTGTGNIDLLNTIYESCYCASKILKISKGSISSGAVKGFLVNKQYNFEYATQDLLEDEIFKKIGDYQVSTRGRVITKKGLITVGSDIPDTIYRNVFIKLKGDDKSRNYLVHDLILTVFVRAALEGEVGMHNDTYNTLDSTGYQRNWLCDLSWGTQQQNSQSYNDNRTDLKRVRCVDTNVEYHSAGAAGRDMGLNCGNISAICQKKRKTTGGKTFEYC